MSLDIFNSYAHISHASSQTTRFAVGNHMELDTLGFVGTGLSGTDVELTTGSQQANGEITLKNHRYLVYVEQSGWITSGALQCRPTLPSSATIRTNEIGGGTPATVTLDSNITDSAAPGSYYMFLDASGGDISFRFRMMWVNTTINNAWVRVYIYKLGVVDGGATFDSYAQLSMVSHQTSNLDAGDHVEWDTISRIGTVADASAVALTKGAGQLDGVVTLDGYRFLVLTGMLGQCNSGRGAFWWTDTGGTQIADELGGSNLAHLILRMADNNQGSTCGGPTSTWWIVDAITAPVEMELRIKEEWALNEVWGAGQSYVLFIPLLEDSSGGIATILNSQEALKMKSQFIASENLQIVFPPFLDTVAQSFITSVDVVTLTVVKPDGTLYTPAPTAARDANSDFWVAEIDAADFEVGEWQIKAVSDDADALDQYKSIVWGDYMSEIRQATLGRWKINGTDLVLYEDDGVTIFRTFNLKDATGSPSASQIFERDPV